ncbi:MAG: thiolase family protein [Rhodospirillaceae bacterium]
MALRDTAIVGYAETKIVPRSDMDVWKLGAQVMEGLMERTGVDKEEIDGLCLSSSMTGAGNPFWSQATADFLGLELNYCQTVDIGGSSPLGAMARSAAAIEAGLCETVFLLFADTQARESAQRFRSFHPEFQFPTGLMGPPAVFGLISNRYDHQFGLDFEALGKLAVAQRNGAVLNENACEKLRTPITVDDYLNSRMIYEPIRLLDCVMVNDGASGLLLMSKKRAKEKGYDKFVVPTGYGERTNYKETDPIFDPTESGHAVAGQKAMAAAGIIPKDVCSFHPYDDFIIAILLQLEALGFCERGQGCTFVNETDFNFGGDLPLNTGGGQISAGQPGLAGGGVNLVEAVRQLFGEAGERQVKNTKNAMVTGIGGIGYGRNWNTSTVAILEPDG